MSNILVTGGAGFVGSCLVKKLAEKKDDFIVIVDNLLTGDKNNVPKYDNVRFIKADCNNFNDIASVFYAYNFEYVFHYAAVVGVKRTLENPIKVLQDVDGIKNILDLSKNTKVKRVFFSSSSEVYGEPVEFPQNESTTPLNSRLPYAIVKNIGEVYLKSYKQEFDLDFTIFRFFNTYGPSQSTDFVVNRFINMALKNKDITIYGDGRQTRTFCYIDDNIEATTRTFYEGLNINDVINIGNNVEVRIYDLAKKIIEITGSKSEIIHLPPLKEGDMTRRNPDITKMKDILKRDLISVEKGIELILEKEERRFIEL